MNWEIGMDIHTLLCIKYRVVAESSHEPLCFGTPAGGEAVAGEWIGGKPRRDSWALAPVLPQSPGQSSPPSLSFLI